MKKSDKSAVLLIHGFMGNPGEFNNLESILHDFKYDIYSFVLKGHEAVK